MANYYSIRDILNVARIHPLYESSTTYPPSPDRVAIVLKNQDEHTNTQLSSQPLLHKDQLYQTVERLCADEDPQNYYRHNSYISITGGGSGKSIPMLFLTSREENQNQRVAMSGLMKALKLLELSDWVLNLHPSGFLYRALDLSTQTIEEAGGTVLCAGHMMPHSKSFAICAKYRINVITGDSAHILNFAHYVASLPSSTQCSVKITKIIYTCEMMTRAKREYLVSVFGPVAFFSMFASAETGPFAVANFSMTGQPDDNTADLIFDTRAMIIEVLSLTSEALHSKSDTPPAESEMATEGTAGHLVLTSLQRLKNPLVRYISGDVGSVHPLPESAASQIDPDLRSHLKVLRLHGRDQRFSFKWLSEYYEFDKLSRVMQTDEWGILHWQLIVEHGTVWEGSDSIELRLMRRSQDSGIISEEELIGRLGDVFYLTSLTEKLFRAVFVDDAQGFERSETSNKVIRFIDRRH